MKWLYSAKRRLALDGNQLLSMWVVRDCEKWAVVWGQDPQNPQGDCLVGLGYGEYLARDLMLPEAEKVLRILVEHLALNMSAAIDLDKIIDDAKQAVRSEPEPLEPQPC